MTSDNPVVSEHEPFYRAADLGADMITCADDRTDNGIRVFGGAANPIYQDRIMQEAAEPGSCSGQSFENDVRRGVTAQVAAGFVPAVHSQQSTEHDDTVISADNPEDIGCAWIKLRQQLSQMMTDNRQDLVMEANALRAELFRDEDKDFIVRYFDAHARLAANNDYFSTGRKVAIAAVEAGAKSINVYGEHDPAADGEINLVANQSMNGAKAKAANLPAYDHSSWAVLAINQELSSFDSHQLQIADLLDALNTMNALKVGRRAIRRGV